MMAIKIEGQGDIDLNTLFELMDEALTSKDERVQSALRSLLMIVTLTRAQDTDELAIEDRVNGPLRQMKDDLNDLTRRLYRLEEELYNVKQTMINPYTGTSNPYYTGTGAGGPYNWSSTDLADISINTK